MQGYLGRGRWSGSGPTLEGVGTICPDARGNGGAICGDVRVLRMLKRVLGRVGVLGDLGVGLEQRRPGCVPNVIYTARRCGHGTPLSG